MPLLPSHPHPQVVIVGGGQCGLALAARLQRMSVPYVVLDQNPRPGDSWRNRGFDDDGFLDFLVIFAR